MCKSVGAIMAVLFAVAAGVLGGSIAAAEDGVTNDTVVVGAYGPLTGPAAYIGLGGRDGMALAVKEINDAGGIHGRKIRVVFEDDGFSPTKALAAVKKLIEQDKAFMIFGVSGSNPTVGTLDYLRGLKAPNYVSFASAPQVTRPFNKYFFRGGTTEAARYGELYAEFITQFLQAKRIAIFSGSDEFPKNEGDATERLLNKWYGIKPALRVEFKVGDKDFTPQLLKIKEANPEVIMTLGHVTEASIIVRQARELGLRQPIFGSGAMVDNALIANAGYAAEGFMGGWLTGVFLDSCIRTWSSSRIARRSCTRARRRAGRTSSTCLPILTCRWLPRGCAGPARTSRATGWSRRLRASRTTASARSRRRAPLPTGITSATCACR
jgi:branched-chain amino acid transport system substrate-binding protein